VISIKNILTLDGTHADHEIASQEDRVIDGSALLLLPALIDPHVHFRTPGLEHKEDWHHAARACLSGGITTVFDMPNTLPACVTMKQLREKERIIDGQLESVGIPLHYRLYLGADKSHFDEIVKAKGHAVGLKVFMGSSTGGLVMDDESSLHAAFSLAAVHGLVLTVHAEDEALIHERQRAYTGPQSVEAHSIIRNREVAIRATEKAIGLAKMYGTRLYLAHISTKEEIALIAEAKREGVTVFCEVTPHHLFLTEKDYAHHGTSVQMNPPLRSQEDCDALFEGIRSGVVDTIGSDHAPHTRTEKDQPYGKAPSGIPGVETTLPLLLNAHHEGKIELKRIVSLMRFKIEEIFGLTPTDDFVLVDLKKRGKIERLYTKCNFSPYADRVLSGFPVTTILKGKIYDLTRLLP